MVIIIVVIGPIWITLGNCSGESTGTRRCYTMTSLLLLLLLLRECSWRRKEWWLIRKDVPAFVWWNAAQHMMLWGGEEGMGEWDNG